MYEELESTEKSASTRKMNEFTKARDEHLKKVKNSRSRLDATKSLLNADSEIGAGSSRSL